MLRTKRQENPPKKHGNIPSVSRASARRFEEPESRAKGRSVRVGVVEIQELAAGAGREAAPGDTVAVHYTGWLADGKRFDSSAGGEPFENQLGAREVIAGWEQGIAGMRMGGKRRLTVPPELGYGSRGFPGVIPPQATLVFEVELVALR